MKYVVTVILMFLANSGLACPIVDLGGAQIHASSTDLYDRQIFEVTAGGTEDSSACGIVARTGEQAYGYVAQAPDFELRYYKNTDYKLLLKVESECDSTLLINTGLGNWYFDDDDAGNLDAQIYLTRPSDGWYDIWVGSVSPDTCEAHLSLETYN